MKTIILDLTPEEYSAITNGYPISIQLYYIWVGIITCNGYKAPMTLAELKIKHIGKRSYSVTVVD